MNVPRFSFVASLFLLGASACGVESVSYRAFVLDDSGAWSLLADGTVEYRPGFDVLVGEMTAEDGSVRWEKGIRLFDDWLLVAHIARRQELSGFGLRIRNITKAKEFSWEWFQKVENDLFEKLQGTGKVRVLVRSGPNYEELVAVEFLDDVTLRYLEDMTTHDSTDHTHEIVVRKGSVLRLAP